MNDKIIQLILWLITAGVIASPCFVYEKINAQACINTATFATKENVSTMQQDINDIKQQQKTDHDLLIKLCYKFKVK